MEQVKPIYTLLPNVALETNVSGTFPIWKGGSSSLDATGSASRNFGGLNPPRNNFGAGLSFKYEFGG